MSRVVLGDVAIERRETCKGSKNGYPIVGLEHLTPEEITLTAWDKGKENTFSKLFREGDVLFGRRRAYLKKAAVAPFDGICSGDITVIEAMPERILPELLPFIIQNDTLFEFAVGKSAGSLSPRVKWEKLKNYEFELPEMDKQRDLAKTLWSIDTTKKTYQKMLQKTDELLKSHFIELFGAVSDKKENCEYVELSDLCSKDSSNISFKSVEGVVGEYPLYGAAGLMQYIDGYKMENEYIGIIKDGAGVGRVYRLPAFSSIINTMQYIIPCHGVNIRYLESLLRYMELGNDSTGSTIPHIYFKDYSKRIVPKPIIQLQEQFAAFVQQSDKSKFELQQALSELDATYKKIISENLG
jgi:type I restriction enzyme S subunit